MDQEQGERELQLLLLPAGVARVLRDVLVVLASTAGDHPQLDLDLSMSIGPRQQLPPAPSLPAKENRKATVMVAVSAARHQQQVGVDVRAVKQQTAEQVRWASAERTYAEPAPSPPAKENRRAAVMVAVSAARHQQQKQQVGVDVRAVKQHTAKQVRWASAERTYAECVWELELTKKEFACARMIWERAREEVVRVERMEEIATQRLGSTTSAMALEITCHGYMQCFHL